MITKITGGGVLFEYITFKYAYCKMLLILSFISFRPSLVIHSFRLEDVTSQVIKSLTSPSQTMMGGSISEPLAWQLFQCRAQLSPLSLQMRKEGGGTVEPCPTILSVLLFGSWKSVSSSPESPPVIGQIPAYSSDLSSPHIAHNTLDYVLSE